jgi:hypothetical protein
MLFVSVALLFEYRANVAAEVLSARPWKTGLIGFVTALVMVPIGLVLYQNPILRLVGILILLVVMMLSAIGGAGIALVAARRIRALDPNMNPFAALCRGAAFVVVPAMLPILGWLLLGPAIFFVGIGAGLRAMVASQTATRSVM